MSVRSQTPRRWLFAATSLCALVLLAGCKPNYPKCKEDDHCAEHGEVCIDGTCKQCRNNSQCKPGYECKANACVEKPECTTNADCKQPLVCKNQKCVPQCTTDADCPSGQMCQNQQCVPKVECDATHPCPAGETCLNNKCVAEQKQEVVKPPPPPPQCELETVHFGFNDYSLSEGARTTLEKDAECVKQRKQPVAIEGFCDERGTEEYNITLGNRRADSVRRYLVGLGVPEGLLSIVSYGKERPVDPEHNEEAWAKNRRAEFVIK